MAVTVLEPAGRVTLSWDAVEELSVRVAADLLGRGVDPGSRVAVVGDTGLSSVVLAAAARCAGLEICFLGPADAPAGVVAGMADRLRRLGADVVIGPGADLPAFAPEAGGHRIAVEDLGSRPPRTAGPALRNGAPERHRLLQFTSGTTADPRRITLEPAAVTANLDAIGARLGLTAGDSIFCWLPLNHDLGLVGSLLLAAHLRCELTLCAPRVFLGQPSRWAEWLAAARPTYLPAPNSGWSLLLSRAGARHAAPMRAALSSVRSAVTGGEPVDPGLCAQLVEGPRALVPAGAVVPAYGLAEATLAVTVAAPGDPVRTAPVPGTGTGTAPVVSVGAALAGTSVTIRGDDGPLPDGEVGEIVVRGRSLAREYADLPTGLATGDEGFMLGTELFVTGRRKDLIKVNGRRVFPHEIERAAESSGVARPGRTVAFSVPARPAERVVLLVEVADRAGCGGEQGMDLVRRQVQRDLGVRLDVVAAVERGSIPKTTSGKLQRRLARERWLVSR